MNKLLSCLLALGLLTTFAGAAQPAGFPTNEQLRQFRHGDVKALTDYTGAPAILVCVYKRELVQLEGTVGFFKYAILTHGRVIASSAPGFPFGHAICNVTIREGDKEPQNLLPAKGELLYILAPLKVQTRFATGEIMLDESYISAPLEGRPDDYERARRHARARGYGEEAEAAPPAEPAS